MRLSQRHLKIVSSCLNNGNAADCRHSLRFPA
jgi:hypothetical protein